jgi:hypothetical protein
LVLVALFATYGPDPAIIVDPRTTVVTEPLAADGLPDYEAAWLAIDGWRGSTSPTGSTFCQAPRPVETGHDVTAP